MKCSLKVLSDFLQRCHRSSTGSIAFEELKKYYYKLSDFYRENPIYFEIRGEPNSLGGGGGGGRELVLLGTCELEMIPVNDAPVSTVAAATTSKEEEEQTIELDGC